MVRTVSMANIRNRFPMGVIDRVPAIQGIVNRTMDCFMGLPRLNRHVDRVGHLSDLAFFEGLVDDLGIRYVCSAADQARIPRTGRCVVTANHPTGITELALLNYLGRFRRDVRVVINEVLLDIASNAKGLLIPLPVFVARGSRDQIEIRRRIDEALEQEMMLLFFPSGVISNRCGRGRIEDETWKKGAIHAARRARAPIIPVYLGARNSRAFYLIRSLGKAGEFMSWTLLFREYMRHKNGVYPIRIGEPVTPKELRCDDDLDSQEIGVLAEMLRTRVYSLEE